MQQWNFYYSGILYGIICDSREDGGELTHQALNPFSGQLSESETFTDDSFYDTLCKRRLLNFFEDLPEYNGFLSTGAESFKTLSGSCFSRRQDGSYIQRNIKFPMDFLIENNSIYAVVMCGRDYTGVLVREDMEQKSPVSYWESAAIYPVCQPKTYMVPTRDQELLATDVYLPEGAAYPLPSVLIRTPYGKTEGKEQYYRFVQRGYAVVIQDTRGREDSTGEWLPNYYEVEDGDDTLNWIAAQSWSDGQTAMTGGSYLGFVQWAAAASGNPHLKAILSFVCSGSPFVDLPRRGGCFISGSMAWNFAMSEKHFRPDYMDQKDWDEILAIRPVEDMPKIALGTELPFLNKWLEHPHYDEFWKQADWYARSQGQVVPALIISGWFDDNGMGTTEALDLVKRFYPEGTYKAVLGPWKHSGNADYDVNGYFMGENALRYDMDFLCFQWLEHFLKGVSNGIEKTAAMEYYTLGSGCWKEADVWPPADTIPTEYYLSTQPSDNGFGGTLFLCKPGAGSISEFTYDPENPSTHIIDMAENELEVPADYTEEEKRSDMLIYSTPVLEKDLTLTGDVTAVLYLSSDCPDTDLFVRITDVDENGTSIKLADGVIDVKYRNGFYEPDYMEPGEVYEIRIRTTKLSAVFKAGHRLRFTVTSSAKNFMFPNSNTEAGFDSTVTRIAHNQIHCGGNFASKLILPVEIN